MSPLELRKQLLVAESELNRIELAREWGAVVESVSAFAERARTITSLAAAAAALVAGLASLRRARSAAVERKPSWFQTLVHGGRLAVNVWSEYSKRSQR